jgi:UDP-N-acetylmuramate--alanine ligase
MFPFKKVHIVGISGSGLNGIANILLQMGVDITGADKSQNQYSEFFLTRGVKIYSDTDLEPLDGVDLLFVTSALKVDHPLIVEANKRGITVWTRHQLFPVLFADRQLIAVSGSHGKTTTTSIIKHILQFCGVDCGYLIGVPDPRQSSHLGTSDIFVIEADEYAKTLLTLTPKIAIINNIDWDHPDIYPTAQDYYNTFEEFVDITTANDGVIIANSDDKQIQSLYNNASKDNKARFQLFGRHINSYNHIRHIRHEINGIRIGLYLEDTKYINNDAFAPFMGEHNAMNITAGYLVAQALGLSLDKVTLALKSLPTVNRRCETLGITQNKITVLDDYAHAATEIQATLIGLKKAHPKNRIVAIWQPHSFNRISQFETDFVRACGYADEILITPVYDGRGTGAEYNFEAFRQGLNPKTTHFVDQLDDIIDIVTRRTSAGDILVLLNAGDLNKIAPILVKSLNMAYHHAS